MVTRARSIIVAAIVAAVTVASATAATVPRPSGCRTPRLVGLTERAAARTARAAGCAVRLTGARLKQATIQTVAAQNPSPGARALVVRLTLNPLCTGEVLAGPPPNEGMRAGPTELITGVYLVGGPVRLYSTPHCRHQPDQHGTPIAGTIDVLGPTGTTVLASQTVARGHLVTFKLAPGRYRVSGLTRAGSAPFARAFTIRAGFTTRRYVIEPVP